MLYIFLLSIDVIFLTVTVPSPKLAVSEAAAKVLYRNSKWAASVPGFRQLSARDQAALYSGCWVRLFILGCARHLSAEDLACLRVSEPGPGSALDTFLSSIRSLQVR